MPAPNVSLPADELTRRCARHEQILVGSAHLAAGVQKLLAELILIRLFDEFQEAVSGVALRLACGALYADGSHPVLLAPPASSTVAARALFEGFGRVKHESVRWSKVSYINATTRYVLDATDDFTEVINAHAAVIADMRAVRNRIAHANASSRAAFAAVVRKHYGARRNHVSPGMFLLSPRSSARPLDLYLATCRVIARDCVKA